MKLLLSCGTLLQNPKSNWSIANCHQNFTRIFVIARHTCHICIYRSLFFSPLLYKRLPFLLKRNWFCRFLLSFGGFGNFAIRWYSDPHLKYFQGVIFFCIFSKSSTARASSFSFLILLIFFSTEWFVPPQKVKFVWTECALSLFLPKPELLSIFR